MIKVKITDEESNLIECLFYKTNAYKDLINFLGTSDMKLLSDYTETYTLLEREKNALDKKYHPADENISKFTFDFIERTINYE